MYTWNDGTELYHHGIKGQKWGVRRFQNEDGSLTAAGRERYGVTLEPMRRNREASGYRPGAKTVDANGNFRPRNNSNRPESYATESRGKVPRLTKNDSVRADRGNGRKMTREGAYLKDLVNRQLSSEASVNPRAGYRKVTARDYAKDLYNNNYDSGDHIFVFGNHGNAGALTFKLNPHNMSEEDFVRIFSELSALDDLEYDLNNGYGDFSYSAVKEATGDGLNPYIRMGREYELMLKDIENEIRRCEFTYKNHKEKRTKGVDQKVELN